MNDFRYITTSMCCKRRKIPAYVFLDSCGKFRNPSRAESAEKERDDLKAKLEALWDEMVSRHDIGKDTSNGN